MGHLQWIATLLRSNHHCTTILKGIEEDGPPALSKQCRSVQG